MPDHAVSGRSGGGAGFVGNRPGCFAGRFPRLSEAHNLEADWDSIARANNETLVNALSIMSPFGPAEKQALLEAPDLKTRAATLIAITEMVLARVKDDDFGSRLQ